MKPNDTRKNQSNPALILSAILLLLVAGCANSPPSPTFGRNVPAPGPAVSHQPASDVQSLQAQNEMLASRLTAMESSIMALKQAFSAEEEKQRRFRANMTTNFDLLEQSVALSLAKSLQDRQTKPTKNPVGAHQPANRKPPAQPTHQPPQPQVPLKGMPAGKTLTHSENLLPKDGGIQGTNAKPDANSVARETEELTRSTPFESMPLAATPTAYPVLIEDPDLRSPEKPRKLVAHPKAKPLYERAFSQFARKQFDQAIVLFEDFLRRFPNDHYSDNAQFWVGESHFRMNRYDQAEVAYRNVLRHYEHRSTLEGYKTPDAIYRLAQTLSKRNDTPLAKVFFETAAERFPGTSAGRRAQHELQTLVARTASN